MTGKLLAYHLKSPHVPLVVRVPQFENHCSRGSVLLRPLPNADFLSSDWLMRLWEGQPFSFEKFLVMSL